MTFTEGVTTLSGNVAINASGQAAFTTSSLAAGSHTITATYNGTTSFSISSGSVTQIVNQPPTINAPTVTQPNCQTPTGTIVVNATGSGTLEYRLNTGSWQTSNTFSGLAPGSYNISVRLQSTSSCVASYSGNPVVLDPATGCCVPPTINAPTVTQPTCAVPTGKIVVNATGSGTLEYRLNTGSWQTSNTFSGLAPGNYNIAVRLQSNPSCSATYSNNPVVIKCSHRMLFRSSCKCANSNTTYLCITNRKDCNQCK